MGPTCTRTTTRARCVGSAAHAFELARVTTLVWALWRRFRSRAAGQEELPLIELMEGVEDIPGTALHQGHRRRWIVSGIPRPRSTGCGPCSTWRRGSALPRCVNSYVSRGNGRTTWMSRRARIPNVARDTRGARRGRDSSSTTSRSIPPPLRHCLVPGTYSTRDSARTSAGALGEAGTASRYGFRPARSGSGPQRG